MLRILDKLNVIAMEEWRAFDKCLFAVQLLMDCSFGGKKAAKAAAKEEIIKRQLEWIYTKPN